MSRVSDITDEKLIELSRRIDSMIVDCLKEGLSLNATNGVILARLMVTNRDLMNEDNFIDFVQDVTKDKHLISRQEKVPLQ